MTIQGQPPIPRRRRRWPWYILGGIVGVCVLMMIIGAIVGPPPKKTDTTTAAATKASATAASALSAAAATATTASSTTATPASATAHALPPAPGPLTIPASTPAPATATCTDADQASASPSFDAEQFNAAIAQPLSQDVAAYHTAVSSGDIGQIQEKAGTLYSDVGSFENLMSNGRFFGCWDNNVLQSVFGSGNQLSSTMNTLNVASAADAPGLERSAAGPLHDYIGAVGAYADQFGGQHPQE